MGKQVDIRGTYKTATNYIDVNLSVIIFVEDNTQIVYCPALEVSGYGKTEVEANESFNIALSDFFQYTQNKNTFFDEMRRMGWVVRKSKTKPMHPPTMGKLLSENDNFSRIFNDFPFRKINQNISIPVNALEA